MIKRILLLAAALVVISLSSCSFGAAPAVPLLSHETGCYSEAFTLTVTPQKGMTIRYTTDGSLPTAESPVFPADGLEIADRSSRPNVLSALPVEQITWDQHSLPDTVSKGTVIRAAAFDRKGQHGDETTASYFVGLDYEGIKLISLVMDSADLTDYERGIYVMGKVHDDWLAESPTNQFANTWEVEGNFTQTGRDWERNVLVQVLEKDGVLGIEQDMGIRIMGAASRTYFQKSFRLTAREEYGSKHFEYPIIDGLTTESDGQPLEKYKSFVLRNGGNDNSFGTLRDPFIQSRLTDRSFATQGTEPAVVFINGEYWGLYTITEDYSDNYIQYNYGVDNENVVLIKRRELEEGTEDDIDLYLQLMADLEKADLTAPEALDWLDSVLDLQGFIDYYAVNIYTNNMDGIIQDNNWRIWRSRTTDPQNPYADGRWRFMLYDTEYSLGIYEDGYNFDTDTLGTALETEYTWGGIFAELMDNPMFRERFIGTLMDLRNTAFEPGEAWEALTAMGGEYLPFAAQNYWRNGPVWLKEWGNPDTRLMEEMGRIKFFLDRRFSFTDDMLRRHYDDLGELCYLTLRSQEREGGTITVNTARYDLSGGSRYPDYFAGTELTVTACPAEGYTFAGWLGDAEGQEQSFTVTLTDNAVYEAVFQKAA